MWAARLRGSADSQPSRSTRLCGPPWLSVRSRSVTSKLRASERRNPAERRHTAESDRTRLGDREMRRRFQRAIMCARRVEQGPQRSRELLPPHRHLEDSFGPHRRRVTGAVCVLLADTPSAGALAGARRRAGIPLTSFGTAALRRSAGATHAQRRTPAARAWSEDRRHRGPYLDGRRRLRDCCHDWAGLGGRRRLVHRPVQQHPNGGVPSLVGRLLTTTQPLPAGLRAQQGVLRSTARTTRLSAALGCHQLLRDAQGPFSGLP
jgi:hypothetical protein